MGEGFVFQSIRMSHKTYNWKRFWCPRSGSISLADGGYLSDPEATWGKAYNPDLVTFDTLLASPCVALLGEPGIGKTQALERETSELVSKIKEQGNQSFFLNLRSYGDESRLVRKLFESPEFIAWKEGSHQLHIFLDSLDECLLRIDTLATLLVDEFRPYQDKIDRLYLRIACRTAVWPSVLEEGLRKIWGEEAVKVYELAPLRYADVAEAAKDEGFLSDTFLEEIEQKSIVPLAINPITLGFLFNIYRRDRQFAESQTLCDLYLAGCRIMCDEEDNRDLRSAGREDNLEIEQRLILAARIAVVTIFANRDAVWTGQDRGQTLEEDVLCSELVCGYERADGRPFEPSKAAILEVLETSLFSSCGSHRRAWAHRTYAEFLAAWYLKQHSINLSQALNLIIHNDHRVVSQLRETTAWLASMMPDLFQEVIKTDPDVLLNSDILLKDNLKKVELVDSLLNLFNEERLKYFQIRQYKKINHPELASQLEPYILDATKNQWSRLVAIDIAEDCDVSILQARLVDVVLASTELYIVRVRAAHAVCIIGDEVTKSLLKPLVYIKAEDDPNDDLKGYALRAVWPKHITVEELLDNFSQPNHSGGAIPIIGGIYQNFIATEFAQHLHVDDLPVAIKWLEKLPANYDLHYPFRDLADAVILKAWQNLEKPGVSEAFACLAILRLRKYEPFLSEYLSQVEDSEEYVELFLQDSDQKRRKLIESIVLLISDSEEDLGWLTQIFMNRDFFWMVAHIQPEQPQDIQRIWSKLLQKTRNYWWEDAKRLNAILEACEISAAMRSEVETQIELGSEKAKQAQSEYLQYQNWSIPPAPKPKPLLDPPPKERVLLILEKVEAGQPELWWQMCMALALTPTSTHWNDDAAFSPDLTQFCGWTEAEVDTKQRIIKTAKVYLDVTNIDVLAGSQKNSCSNEYFAIYQALHLLESQEPDFISTISGHLWGKLMLAILKSLQFHHGIGSRNDEHSRKILRCAHQGNSGAFTEALIILMQQMNYQSGTYYSNDIYRSICDLLDENLAKSILSKLKYDDLSPGMLEILLADFFKDNIGEAKAFAVSLISSSSSYSGGEKTKVVVVAGRMLALHPDNTSWPLLWSAMQKDYQFGREVVAAIAPQALHTGQIEKQIKEEYVARLYIFLEHQYPECNRSESKTQSLSGVKAISLVDFDMIRLWKNYIPQRIQNRGTSEACEAIEKIIDELPEQKERLQPILLEAKDLMRRRNWKPPKPGDILQLVMVPEPSNLDLSNQLGQIGQDIQQMADEPKIVNKIHAPNSSINAPIGNSGPVNNQVTNNPTPVPEKETNWGNRIAIISLLVAIVAIPIGIFNSEINQQVKQWLHQSPPASIEPQSKPPSK
jgi:hypothetical protein